MVKHAKGTGINTLELFSGDRTGAQATRRPRRDCPDDHMTKTSRNQVASQPSSLCGALGAQAGMVLLFRMRREAACDQATRPPGQLKIISGHRAPYSSTLQVTPVKALQTRSHGSVSAQVLQWHFLRQCPGRHPMVVVGALPVNLGRGVGQPVRLLFGGVPGLLETTTSVASSSAPPVGQQSPIPRALSKRPATYLRDPQNSIRNSLVPTLEEKIRREEIEERSRLDDSDLRERDSNPTLEEETRREERRERSKLDDSDLRETVSTPTLEKETRREEREERSRLDDSDLRERDSTPTLEEETRREERGERSRLDDSDLRERSRKRLAVKKKENTGD